MEKIEWDRAFPTRKLKQKPISEIESAIGKALAELVGASETAVEVTIHNMEFGDAFGGVKTNLSISTRLGDTALETVEAAASGEER